MDPLSGAASVIAVVSLVAQVSESIKKLNDFRLSVKNAPQDIIQLGDQLVVLEDILKAVSRKIQAANKLQSLEVDASHPLYGAMRICQNIALELKQVVEYFETRYRRRGAKSLRTSVLSGWRKGRIKELKDQLDFACKVLLLQGTLGCSSWQVDKLLVTVSDSMEGILQISQAEDEPCRSQPLHTASLVAPPSANPPKKRQGVTIFSSPDNTLNTTIRNRRTILRERTWTSRFGVLCIRTYTNKYAFCLERTPESASNQTYTLEETEFRFVPTWGSTGFQLSTSCSSNQWIPASLRSSFIVPDNSKIFELCLDTRCDNTSEVLNVFSQGRASPFDTNIRGETLLHAAAFACNPVLCKALLKSGADPLALDRLGKLVALQFHISITSVNCEILLLILILSIDLHSIMLHLDFQIIHRKYKRAVSWQSKVGWTPGIYSFSKVRTRLCVGVGFRTLEATCASGFSSHDKPWFDIHRMDSHGNRLLDIVLRLWVLDVSSRPMGQSEWVGPMKWLIRAGSDIHLQGSHRCSILVWVMYLTTYFEAIAWHWFDILKDCGVDVVRYFEEEREINENVTIFVNRYIPERSCSEEFRTCLVFHTEQFDAPVVTMKYLLPPELDYEELPLFSVFKDILGSSDSGFHLLFNPTLLVYQSPSDRERKKEHIREDREREGKQASMVRRRHKLLARLHSPQTCWSKVRSEAKRAITAENEKSLERGDQLSLDDASIKFSGKHRLFTVLFYECLDFRSFCAWAFLLVLGVSLGANVLLFRLWMSS